MNTKPSSGSVKLIQKHLFKGLREFEILEDFVKFRSKAPFKEAEEMTVMLTVLNPEPVITEEGLHFTSRVNGETLLSFYLGKPNPETFNSFIGVLKRKALDEYNAFAGLKPANNSAGLGMNVYDEPPSFDDDEPDHSKRIRKDLDAASIDEAIQMLETYLESEEIGPLLSALQTLKSDPDSETKQLQVMEAFNALGPIQGAVLTYAPYVGILLSDDPFAKPY